MTINKRIDDLELATGKSEGQPTYISISEEQWEQLQAGVISPADLGITRQKIYVGISPADWPDND